MIFSSKPSTEPQRPWPLTGARYCSLSTWPVNEVSLPSMTAWSGCFKRIETAVWKSSAFRATSSKTRNREALKKSRISVDSIMASALRCLPKFRSTALKLTRFTVISKVLVPKMEIVGISNGISPNFWSTAAALLRCALDRQQSRPLSRNLSSAYFLSRAEDQPKISCPFRARAARATFAPWFRLT